MNKDDYRMIVLLLAIGFMAALGMYLVNPGYADLMCTEFNQSYTAFEPYKAYEYQTIWGSDYFQVLDKIAINIPSVRPNYISYNLCSRCRYNVTFVSDKPTNFFVFDEFNKLRYFESRSAFPIVMDASARNTTFSFEIEAKGKYYFVFDRSAQGTTRNDPATGRLIIKELKGLNYTTQVTKYREVTRYRNVTVCD
jgi:hypothetical protein